MRLFVAVLSVVLHVEVDPVVVVVALEHWVQEADVQRGVVLLQRLTAVVVH